MDNNAAEMTDIFFVEKHERIWGDDLAEQAETLQTTDKPACALDKRNIIILSVVCLVVGVAAILLGVCLSGHCSSSSTSVPPDEDSCLSVNPFGLIDADSIQYQGPNYFQKTKYKRNLVGCDGVVTDSEVSVGQDGHFFLSLSGGLQNSFYLHYEIRDESNATLFQLVRRSVAHTGSDVISRAGVLPLAGGSRLRTVVAGGMFDRDTYLLSSWSGVRLEAVLDPLVAFAAESTGTHHSGRLPFDEIVANVGGGFDAGDSRFTASEAGIYFFSFSIGVTNDTDTEALVSLNHNNDPFMYLKREENMTDTLDTLSQSVLLAMAVGDTVDVHIERGTVASSAQERVTSLSGFLYSPSAERPAMAWSLYRTEGWTPQQGGAYSPVQFDGVLLNEGEAFNTSSHYVELPESGVYYIHASVGILPGHKVWLQIRHNNVNVGSVARLYEDSPGEDVISRGVMLEAEAGDTLHLWTDACPSCGFHSTLAGKFTTFTGMLMAPLSKDIRKISRAD